MALTNGQSIIDKFELYAGDETELSSAEELDLLNKKYFYVLNLHEWEFLKKEATGTLSTSVDYVDIAVDHADFYSFAKNHDNNQKVVYIGDNYEPYEIIPFGNRRQYRNNQGYAYYDVRQKRLTFTKQPSVADSYEFDYIYKPDDLTTATAPVFPVNFWDAIYHAMLLDNDIIQMSDKARREYQENQQKFEEIMSSMYAWNASITNQDTYGIQ